MVTIQHIQGDEYLVAMPGEENTCRTAIGSVFALKRLKAYTGNVEYKPHSTYYYTEIYRAYHLHNGRPAALYIGLSDVIKDELCCGESLDTVKRRIRACRNSVVE